MVDHQQNQEIIQDSGINTQIEPSPSSLKTVVLEVNGQKIEMPVEEFDKERRKVQLYKAATEKFNKASEKEKLSDEILHLFKAENFSEKSLRELAKKNNISKETLLNAAERLLGEDIEYERMSDLEKENYELKRELQEKKDREEIELEQTKNRKLVMETTKAQQEFITELQKIESKTFLDVFDPEIFQIVKGTYIRHNLEGNTISLSDAVEIVEEQYKKKLDNQKTNTVKLKTMLNHALKGKGFDEKDIDALIDGGAKAFRERLIEKTKESAATPFTTSVPRNVNQDKSATPKLSPTEFYRKLKYHRE